MTMAQGLNHVWDTIAPDFATLMHEQGKRSIKGSELQNVVYDYVFLHLPSSLREQWDKADEETRDKWLEQAFPSGRLFEV